MAKDEACWQEMLFPCRPVQCGGVRPLSEPEGTDSPGSLRFCDVLALLNVAPNRS